MLITLRKKAQSTAEYVMLFAIVLGAVAMARSYLSKAIAGGIQFKANELLTKTGGSLYKADLDLSNTTKSARQSNEKQHQDSHLLENHAYNENSTAKVENASIGGDLQEAKDTVDGYFIAPGAWDQKGSKVGLP